MKIVADQNIPYLDEALRGLGDFVALPGSALKAEVVREAELLFTRSTVKIGPALLEGSRVRFVATATIGVDHVDLPYLAERGISFASAPGSNSNSVAEWFINALYTQAARQGFDPTTKTIGVVGVGNVGSKVARNARGIGARVLLCDPPLARQTGDAAYRPLDELLSECDILTLHVPLEKGGSDPTVKMLGEREFARMKPGLLLINAARGPVIDEDALHQAREAGRFSGLLLDVFASEPSPDPRTILHANLASPHVAGHSLDGKAKGTQMVYQAACQFLGIAPTWEPSRSLPPTPVPEFDLREQGSQTDAALLLSAMRSLHHMEDDDAFMREIAALSTEERGKRFSAYRNHYRPRREATYTTVHLPAGRSALAQALSTIGFRVVMP
jgi:erythronate-4-phosphate dehydrogenase